MDHYFEPGGRETWGSRRYELGELDRLLAMLSRPVRLGAGVPKSVRGELRDLGLASKQAACRQELIELVWQRKRPLLRQLHQQQLDDPLPPCA